MMMPSLLTLGFGCNAKSHNPLIHEELFILVIQYCDAIVKKGSKKDSRSFFGGKKAGKSIRATY